MDGELKNIKIKDIKLGQEFSMILDEEGSVFGFGFNEIGNFFIKNKLKN